MTDKQTEALLIMLNSMEQSLRGIEQAFRQLAEIAKGMDHEQDSEEDQGS